MRFRTQTTSSTRVRQRRYWKGWADLLAGRTRLSWTSNDGSPGDPCAPEPSSDASIGRALADGSVIQPQSPYVASHCPTYREISHLNRTCLSKLFQDIEFLRVVHEFDSHHPPHSQATPGRLRQQRRRQISDRLGQFVGPTHELRPASLPPVASHCPGIRTLSALRRNGPRVSQNHSPRVPRRVTRSLSCSAAEVVQGLLRAVTLASGFRRRAGGAPAARSVAA